jgi:hypothetical protein
MEGKKEECYQPNANEIPAAGRFRSLEIKG